MAQFLTPHWFYQRIAFQLTGSEKVLSRLHELLSGQGVSIIRDGDRYLLEPSFHSIPLDDPVLGVMNLGAKWEPVINIAVRLHIDNSEKISITAVYSRSDDEWNQLTSWVKIRAEVAGRVDHPVRPKELLTQLIVFFHLMTRESKDPNTLAILRAIRDADFRSPDDVYRVYDAVRTDLGGETELVSRGYLSRKEAHRLRQTLNYPGQASGRRSRKAVARGTPPAAEAMSWADVTATLRSVLRGWVAIKVKENANIGIPQPRRD